MKKQCALGLVLLLSLAGCGWRKKRSEESRSTRTEVFSEVDIPVAGEDVMRSFFDEDVQEFAYVEEPTMDESAQAIDVTQAYDEQASWEKVVAQQDNFTPIYFDFDSDLIKADQEQPLADAISLIKKKIDGYEHSSSVSPMTVVVEGHSDHAAGSPTYNFVLSERRANKLKNRLIAAGVPQEYIKVVGRGQEIPAIVDGRPVSGDRNEQWANRRDEIRIIFA